MFKGVNKVFILGIVESNPEIKYTSSGKAITVIIVYTESIWKDKSDGKLNSKTDWHKIVLYNKFAESVTNYIKKGVKIYIEGVLRSNRWQDKDNITRYNVDIVAINLQILDFNSNINNNNLINSETNKNKNFSDNELIHE